MNSQYQISSDEYVSAGKLNGELSSKVKKVHIAIELVLAIAGIVFACSGEYVLAGGLIGAVIGANLIPFLIRKLYVPWYLKRHYRKYPAIQKPMSIAVLDQGIQFKSSTGEGVVLWNEIHKWRDGADLILIYPAPRIYYMIPKRINEIDVLREALSRNVGNAT